jgi:hypothetical protein
MTVPDTRTHRGPDPRDAALFAPECLGALRTATAELSWLLSRGYAGPSGLKLVGDRHGLTERQRMAVRRCACPDAARAARRGRRVEAGAIRGRRLLIDGFNVLTTVEAALGGAVVLEGRDGSYRDLAGVHGTYRKVAETRPAILLVGETLEALGAGPCRWLLDRPVSNSGRLAAALREEAAGQGWTWEVEVVMAPDALLRGSAEIVATADAAILDAAGSWFPLARQTIERAVPGAWVVSLSEPPDLVA